MVKTIKASPRKPSPSKFGKFNDAVAVVTAQAKYLQTAKALAQKGDRKGSLLRVARARKAITDLPNEAGLGKFLLVAGLVRSEIEIGDLSGARSTLGQLKTDFSRSTAAAAVAVALIKSGDVKSGLQVAEMITAPIGRGEAMGNVASALLHAKELRATKELLRKLGDASDDARAFRAAGATMMELGLGAELHQWVGEMTSNVARAYLCLGAADAKTRRP